MVASAVATIGVLPVFLVGALAPFIRVELGVTEAHMGAAVAAFFLSAAVASVPIGRLVERLDAPRALALGAGASGLVLAGLATPRSFPVLLAWMVAGGLSLSLSQLGANLKLAGAVSQTRQGLAFGIKQSAIPGATLIAGVAVPTIALTADWRWVYAGTAAAALVMAAAQLRGPQVGRPSGPRSTGALLRSPRPLVVLAVAAGLGTATATAMGAFAVEYAVAVGIDPGPAGLVLGVGGLSAIISRIAMGALADRRDGSNLLVATGMLAVGAAAVLTFPHVRTVGPMALVVVVVYAIGWGWAGLFNFAVVRRHRHAPAAATGITQIGVYGGGVIGPVTFGLMVTHLSYAFAWRAAAVVMFAAAVLMFVGRAMARRAWREPVDG